jgi:hypothetical protein
MAALGLAGESEGEGESGEGRARGAGGAALIHPRGAGALSTQERGGPGCARARALSVRQRASVSSRKEGDEARGGPGTVPT